MVATDPCTLAGSTAEKPARIASAALGESGYSASRAGMSNAPITADKM